MAKHQAMFGPKIVGGAIRLQPLLEDNVRFVAQKLPGARMLRPPDTDKDGNPKLRIKDPKDALVKVNKDYAGTWIDIKDMARCTLVVGADEQVETALTLLRAHFRAGNPTHIVVSEEKIVDGAKNKAGYSGWTIFVSLEGHRGEIQVNSPVMMYAKSLKEFVKTYPGKADEMAAMFPAVPGGLGHKLYEVARSEKYPDAVRDAHEKASKAYYDYFRSKPANFIKGRLAFFELVKLGLITDVKYMNTQPQRVADELAKLPKLVNGGRSPPRP
jgi:hypothetical protein